MVSRAGISCLVRRVLEPFKDRVSSPQISDSPSSLFQPQSGPTKAGQAKRQAQLVMLVLLMRMDKLFEQGFCLQIRLQRLISPPEAELDIADVVDTSGQFTLQS